MTNREPTRGPIGGAGDSGAFEGFPKPTFDAGKHHVLRSVDDFFRRIVKDYLRADQEREEKVARLAMELRCGYAVIEEKREDWSTNAIVLTRHYVLSPWLIAGHRMVFDGWGSWEEWQGRGRPQ